MNEALPIIVDLLILTLLVATALIIVQSRRLFSVVMLTGIYSFLSAGWMLVLDAPDVAFTEAAVGAGITTVLFLSTLALTNHQAKPSRHNPLAALAVTVTAGFLVYGTLDMPTFGDPEAPAQGHVAESYMKRTPKDIHIPNVVTAVLASYRGYDTLGETTVVLTACVAVLLLLKTLEGTRMAGSSPGGALTQVTVLRVVTKLLIPYILLFGLYVQFHGDYGPGGGFQAGVIFAAGLILYGVVFGVAPLQRVIRPTVAEFGVGLGVLIYVAVGFANMALGGNFLDYGTLDHHDPAHGQHLGILIVELGVGVTVAAVMLSIFYAFAGRGRR